LSAVCAVLERLNLAGSKVWYDEGLEVAESWPDSIARKITDSSLFIAFISPAYVASLTCNKEITFAFSRQHAIVPIYLCPTELSPSLGLLLGDLHSIMAYKMSNTRCDRALLAALASVTPRNLIDSGTVFGVFHFADLAALNSWLHSINQHDRYIFETGDEGYGPEVLEKEAGRLVVTVRPNDVEELIELARRRVSKEASRSVLTDVEECLGSPGYPNYLWYERNVRHYRGEASLSLDMSDDVVSFSITLPEHFRHEWSGW
jgi:hypothetical protein